MSLTTQQAPRGQATAMILLQRGHDGVEDRFRAYPMVHRAAAENLANSPVS